MNFPCFLWTLLSLSSICSAYILIDPILLIDATHKLSSFLLSAEIQNVKDIADAVFSQENIDAVTLIASNTADVARNTVLNAQSGIDALANSVPTAKVASSLQAFLESNQDLTQSSSEYYCTNQLWSASVIVYSSRPADAPYIFDDHCCIFKHSSLMSIVLPRSSNILLFNGL